MKFHTTITPIKSLKDNYIWAIDFPELKQCIVVDPGESEPVLHHLSKNHAILSDILVTHSHKDHIDGIQALLHKFPDAKVWGSEKERMMHQHHFLEENSVIPLQEIQDFFQIYEIPGHTIGHLVYYSRYLQETPSVFCGDTLFSAGCGRVLGGTVEELYNSLTRLKSFPINTVLYPAHEYTLSNLRFAKWLHPEPLVLEKLAYITSLRQQDKITLPCHLRDELLINPFLRCDDIQFVTTMEQRFGVKITSALQLFVLLRKMKDTWYDTENIF